jgi:hypothetical protein
MLVYEKERNSHHRLNPVTPSQSNDSVPDKVKVFRKEGSQTAHDLSTEQDGLYKSQFAVR